MSRANISIRLWLQRFQSRDSCQSKKPDALNRETSGVDLIFELYDITSGPKGSIRRRDQLRLSGSG